MGVSKADFTIVIILILGTSLAILNQTALNPALPLIMQDMQVNATTVQWLVSAYSLVNAIIVPLSAYFMGRFSIRKLYLGNITLFAIGTLLGVLAPAFPVILAARILQAICAGIVMPMMFSVVLLIFPREKRGAAMGFVTLALCFAPTIGPTLSGIIVGLSGWRVLFAVMFVLALFLLATGAKLLQNFGDFEPCSFDVASVVMCAAGLLCVLYGFSTFSSSDNLMMTGGIILIGLIILIAFTQRQLRLETPLLKVDVFKVHDYRIMVLIAMILQGSLISLNVLMPLYIQNTLGYPAIATGLAMLPGALCGGAASIIAGRLFDRYGVRRCAVPGILGVLAGVGSLMFLGLDTNFFVIMLLYTIFPTAQHFTQTPMNTWGVNSLENRVIQHGNALTNTLNQVSASLMTALLISASALGAANSTASDPLAKQFDGQHLAFIVLTAVALVGVIIIVCFVKDSPKKQITKPVETNETAKDILVDQIMNKTPYYIYENATMKDCMTQLIEHATSGLPIVDEELHVVGFISDGDIMKYLGSTEHQILDSTLTLYVACDNPDFDERIHDLLETDIMDIATRKVISAETGESLIHACKVLSDRRIKKMPITENDVLVGILSRNDIVRETMEAFISESGME